MGILPVSSRSPLEAYADTVWLYFCQNRADVDEAIETRKIIYSFAQDTWAETADFPLKNLFFSLMAAVRLHVYICIFRFSFTSFGELPSQTKRGRTLTYNHVS